MAQKTNSFERFWQELKRRKVVHVVTVYAAIAFVILQLVDLVSQPLHFPEWTQGFIIVLLCIGFIIAVFLSWIYDITPTGVKKTKPASAIKHTDHANAPTSSGWKIATYTSIVILSALLAFNFISKRNLNADISKLDKSIAVLPFFNDSPSDSNQYFINGIMEEVLNNLQKIKDFRVLSRTSTDQYKGAARPTIPEIAKKLGVSYIVEGSGQKYGNSFRLRVQLIAGNNERHLWAESYEKEIRGTKDIYDTQSQIAQSIAEELKAIITPEEKQLIERIPTMNVIAYEFYQKGMDEYWKNRSNVNPQSLKSAENLFLYALQYDSTLALAYMGLAQIQWDRHYWDTYYSESFLDSAFVLVDKAIYHDSLLSEAHTLKGHCLNAAGKVELAIIEFKKAIELNHNDWFAYEGLAYYFQNYDLVKSLEYFRKAISLSHGGFQLPGLLKGFATTIGYAGVIEETIHYLQKALELDKDSISYYSSLAWLYSCNAGYEDAVNYAEKALAIDSNKVWLYPQIAWGSFNDRQGR